MAPKKGNPVVEPEEELELEEELDLSSAVGGEDDLGGGEAEEEEEEAERGSDMSVSGAKRAVHYSQPTRNES